MSEAVNVDTKAVAEMMAVLGLMDKIDAYRSALEKIADVPPHCAWSAECSQIAKSVLSAE